MGCSAVPLINTTTGALEIMVEMLEKGIKNGFGIFIMIPDLEKQLKADALFGIVYPFFNNQHVILLEQNIK